MAAINTTKGIAPGKIVYHVYGSSIVKSVSKGNKDNIDLDANIQKMIVTSFPKNWHYSTNSRTDSLFFDVIRISQNGQSWRSGCSIHDCGINTTHGKYNLNRIFATKVEAREFISECLSGVFFDETDQEVYDRNSRCSEMFI
jgi:hypothetical protein